MSLARADHFRPIAFADAETVVNRFVATAKERWNLDLRLVPTFDALPNEVKDSIKDTYGENAKARGVVHKGIAYVVADEHESAVDVDATILHEIKGHVGIHRLYGPEIKQKLNNLYFAIGGRKGLSRIAEQRGLTGNLSDYAEMLSVSKLNNAQRVQVMMDELLAHINPCSVATRLSISHSLLSNTYSSTLTPTGRFCLVLVKKPTKARRYLTCKTARRKMKPSMSPKPKKKPKPPRVSAKASSRRSAARSKKARSRKFVECLTIFEPQPPSSKSCSGTSEMLTPSEIAHLRQKSKEASAYARKVFKKKPNTPPPNKSNSPETPSPTSLDYILDDRLHEGGRYLAPVSRRNSPKKRPVVDGTLDSASMPIKTITIMPDFGNGPYAWLKDAPDESEWVGGNIADAVGGFGAEYGVPAVLEKQFADWVILFEREYKNPEFDWNVFHREGIALCRRLKQVFGDAYRVVYVKPREDSNYGTNRRTEIFLSAVRPK